MQATITAAGLGMLLVVLAATPAVAKNCKGDAVKVGGVCVDKYEASVWQIPPIDTALVEKAQTKINMPLPWDRDGATG